MNKVKISIVLPNYNHAHYLPQSLDSILSQTVLPHEVILIDDASHDSSLQVMQEYVNKSPIFRIHGHKTNMGIWDTVKESLGLITGTHMLFLGADDWILPDMLENAYAMLNMYPDVGFWSCGSLSIYEDDTNNLFPTPMNYPIHKSGHISTAMAKKILYKQDSWFCGNTMVHNKNLFIKENGLNPQLKSFADNFLYRIMASKYGCCFTPKRLSVWRIRRAGYSQANAQNPQALMAITNTAINIIKTQYAELFPRKLIVRMHRRLLFDVVKSIWIKDQAKLSNDMKNFLSENKLYIGSKFLCVNTLQLISFLPWFRYSLGQIILLLYVKPFDMLNRIKIGTLQLFYRT